MYNQWFFVGVLLVTLTTWEWFLPGVLVHVHCKQRESIKDYLLSMLDICNSITRNVKLQKLYQNQIYYQAHSTHIKYTNFKLELWVKPQHDISCTTIYIFFHLSLLNYFGPGLSSFMHLSSYTASGYSFISYGVVTLTRHSDRRTWWFLCTPQINLYVKV